MFKYDYIYNLTLNKINPEHVLFLAISELKTFKWIWSYEIVRSFSYLFQRKIENFTVKYNVAWSNWNINPHLIEQAYS